jgi:uncharacterized protein
LSDSNNPFLLNVGFIVHQTVGYIRDFPFDFQEVFLPPDTKLNNLTGTVRVTRTPQGLLIQAKMTAETSIECVRCLIEFPQTLEADFTDLYAFNPNSITDSGLILPENGKINLAPILRDEMLVSVPINPVCKPDCKGLCPVCGEDLNTGACHHQAENSDPQFDQLRSFLE